MGMDIETREEIDLDLIEILVNFRWKIIKKEEVGYNTQSSLYGIKVVYTLTRSRGMFHYREINELENEYFRLRDSIKKPVKPFKPAIFFLLLLGILPGVIYIFSNKHKNKVIKKNNDAAAQRMKKIIEEVNIL